MQKIRSNPHITLNEIIEHTPVGQWWMRCEKQLLYMLKDDPTALIDLVSKQMAQLCPEESWHIVQQGDRRWKVYRSDELPTLEKIKSACSLQIALRDFILRLS